MIIITLKRILIYVLLLGGLQQCKPQTDIPNSLDGMLLYIEDLDGVGGSASGRFSDIVAFDPTSSKQYVLTSDNYYDECPTYSSKTKKVYFESKREKYHPAVGLTAKTHLYELDLLSSSITLIDDDIFRKDMLLKKNKGLKTATVNYSGDKLLFQYKWGGYKNSYNRLVLYDLLKSDYTFLFDSLYFAHRYVFSDNDSTIVFQSLGSNDFKDQTNYLAVINLLDNKIEKLVQEENVKNELGDYKYNTIVYIRRDLSRSKVIEDLYIYDLTNKEKSKIANVEELGFREIKYPVFKDENSIYFIGSKESNNPDTFDEDIYLLNLQTKEMKQITFTHNIKDNLRYYE